MGIASTRERIESTVAFDKGDGPVQALIFAEHTDRHEAAIHVCPGYDYSGDPVSVYLDPVGAALLGAQLLAAARAAQHGKAPRRVRSRPGRRAPSSTGPHCSRRRRR